MSQQADLDQFMRGLDYPLFIVTAASETETGPESRSGCLVGFTTRCSIDPLRFLVCISKINHSFQLMSGARNLGVHVVDSGQQNLAELFGGETGDEVDKFAACAWRPGLHGVPILTDCQVAMVAEVLDRVDLGDHVGFVLAPVGIHGHSDADPLRPSDISGLRAGHPL